MKISGVLLGGLIIVGGVGLIAYVSTFPILGGMQYGPGFVPGVLGYGFILCGLAIASADLLKGRAVVSDILRVPLPKPATFVRFLGVLAAIAAFGIIGPALGFLLGSAAAVLIACLVFRSGWRALAVLTLGLPFALHFFFESFMRVTLPRGVLEALLF